MSLDYLEPVSMEVLETIKGLPDHVLGKNLEIFTNDSGKYPFSRYPDETSLDCGSVHSNGKTGNPSLSPSLLLNFPLPSGFNIRGK